MNISSNISYLRVALDVVFMAGSVFTAWVVLVTGDVLAAGVVLVIGGFTPGFKVLLVDGNLVGLEETPRVEGPIVGREKKP